MLYAALLAWITWTDLTEHRIGDEAVILCLLTRFGSGEEPSAAWLLAVLFFAGLSLLGMGWGDTKLAMALYLDGLRAERIALAFLLGCAAGTLCLILGKAKKESHLPMAPFLILSDMICYSIFPALPRTWRIL